MMKSSDKPKQIHDEILAAGVRDDLNYGRGASQAELPDGPLKAPGSQIAGAGPRRPRPRVPFPDGVAASSTSLLTSIAIKSAPTLMAWP